MQMKTVILALMSMTAIAEGSAIQRHHDLLLSRQAKGGFGGGAAAAAKGGNNNANAGAAAAAAAKGGNNNANAAAAAAKGGNNNGNAAAAATATCLSANALQTGSASTGQSGAAADGQVNSKTDNANFINFCSGKTVTNGLQTKGGSCNGIVMGDIPATTNMVSTVILNPVAGTAVTPNKSFNVTVKIANMQLGSFTNATSTYYSAPQQLSSGDIVGHTHITVQDMGNTLAPTTPLDATQFAFFKGINDDGNGQGTLTTEVTDGLPAGNYRVCTMASASNHQPVLMPVAQRGAQDDCTKFTVGGGAANNAAAGGNANANAGAAAKAGAAKAGAGAAKGNFQAQSVSSQSVSSSNSNSNATSSASGSSGVNQANQGRATRRYLDRIDLN